MKGEALVFINFEQAARFGHIGWGFAVDDGVYRFGSTDHLWNTADPMWHPLELIRYMDVAKGKNNDSWMQDGSFDEMILTMTTGHHVRYHAYKSIPVIEPKPGYATDVGCAQKDEGWNVIFNNCVHQTHGVLTKYGAGELPSPYELANRFPKLWFEKIPSEMVLIAMPRHSKLPHESDSLEPRTYL